jgi:hypothetical protein
MERRALSAARRPTGNSRRAERGVRVRGDAVVRTAEAGWIGGLSHCVRERSSRRREPTRIRCSSKSDSHWVGTFGELTPPQCLVPVPR